MLNIVICDDEIFILDKLANIINRSILKNDFNANITLKTTEPQKLFSFISANKVDVVILDIEFKNSQLSGLDIAKRVREISKNCYIIFTTSHYEYVMQAYKFKTFDYIIKSAITVDYMSETLSRLFEDINSSSNNFLKIDNRGSLIDLNDVQFIEKDGMKIIFHTSVSKCEIYSSFSKIEPKLPPNFVRCHKSFIANINNIIQIKSDNSILFRNNSICYIGPKYKTYFMEMINYDTIIK